MPVLVRVYMCVCMCTRVYFVLHCLVTFNIAKMRVILLKTVEFIAAVKESMSFPRLSKGIEYIYYI